MGEPLRVTLVETAPEGAKGSMRRYADLVEAAFEGSPDVLVSRTALAKSVAKRRWLPSAAQTLAHHARVYRHGRRLGRRSSVDLFHVIDGSHGYCIPPLARRPTVVTVHDVIPALQAQGRFPTAPPGLAARVIISLALRGVGRASRLACDSISTQDDLATFQPESVSRAVVIAPPLEPGFSKPEGISGGISPGNYVLHIGNNAFYKNRSGVLRIFAGFAADVPHRLVMAGPPPTSHLRALVAEFGFQDRVEFRTDPSDQEVRDLYRRASLLLFPSVYEGFGWPPLEAMASGCPVVCSDAGSLPEVVGDAALTANCENTEAMAAACREVLTNPQTADRLRQAGIHRASRFTLERFRSELWNVYREAVHGP